MDPASLNFLWWQAFGNGVVATVLVESIVIAIVMLWAFTRE
jgi:hypothetical protein